MEKKGLTTITLAILIGVALVVSILIAAKVSATPHLPSRFQNVPGDCTPKNLAISISGNVDVENSAWLETEPSIKKISVNSVTTPSLVFFEDFRVKVEAIDPLTNNLITQDTSKKEQIDQSDVSVPYNLDFTMPDNNCDNIIDDFDLELKATLLADDPGDVTELDQRLTFRDGRFSR